MTEYSFAARFADAPLGPFTNANKRLVWPDDRSIGMKFNWDPDPEGRFFELVDDDRLGSRCCRMTYPAGAWGMGNQCYQLKIASPGTVANLEFDWLFEEGFDLAPPNEAKVGGGKLGPCINWGEIGGATENRGTRPMIWWNGNGSNYGRPVFSPSCQDQRSGSQHIQPVVYTDPVECERVYRWRIQIMGGPEGFAKYWQDGNLIAQVGPKALQVAADDDVYFDFAFFAGGNADQAPRWDSFARHGNILIWSGEGEPVPEPEPEPEVEEFEIVGGTLLLRRVEASAARPLSGSRGRSR
jgi:hypothetical protein